MAVGENSDEAAMTNGRQDEIVRSSQPYVPAAFGKTKSGSNVSETLRHSFGFRPAAVPLSYAVKLQKPRRRIRRNISGLPSGQGGTQV